MTLSVSNHMRMSFSVDISMKASNLPADKLLLSLLLMNFKVENDLSQATCVTESVSRYL